MIPQGKMVRKVRLRTFGGARLQKGAAQGQEKFVAQAPSRRRACCCTNKANVSRSRGKLPSAAFGQPPPSREANLCVPVAESCSKRIKSERKRIAEIGKTRCNCNVANPEARERRETRGASFWARKKRVERIGREWRDCAIAVIILPKTFRRTPSSVFEDLRLFHFYMRREHFWGRGEAV